MNHRESIEENDMTMSRVGNNVFYQSPGNTGHQATLKMYVKSAFLTPSNFNNY